MIGAKLELRQGTKLQHSGYRVSAFDSSLDERGREDDADKPVQMVRRIRAMSPSILHTLTPLLVKLLNVY